MLGWWWKRLATRLKLHAASNRAKSNEPCFTYKGFNIPLRLAHMTGGADDTFDAISRAHIDQARAVMDLRPDMSIVEIGCGIGRDAIPLSEILSSEGRYFGIEVVKDMVDWCSSAITTRHPNFTFHHFDVAEKWYNPNGKLTLQECVLPVVDNSVDLIILHSVFTHMLAADIQHYMREFARVIKPQGRVLATFFIVNDDILQTQTDASYITFRHKIADGCYVHELEKPTHAVAYDEGAITAMANRSGLRMVGQPHYGIWSGRGTDPKYGQDAVVLERISGF